MNCWDVLGLEETTDRAAIKKAYAARLKVTRPDDDAEGYQTLREACDEALQIAKWRQEFEAEAQKETYAQELASDNALDPQEADKKQNSQYDQTDLLAEGSSGHELAPSLDAQSLENAEGVDAELSTPSREDAPPTLLQTSTTDLAPHDDPAAWAQQLHEAEMDGSQALLFEWQKTEKLLLALPLSQRTQASIAFADMVINRGISLPLWLQIALQQHFQWIGDYRAEYVLGTHRVLELQNVLSHAVSQIRNAPDAVALAALQIPSNEPGYVSAEELEDKAVGLYQAVMQGKEVLESEWKKTHQYLSDLFLRSQHDQASRVFADMVIKKQSMLPVWLLIELLKHFEWLDDHRREKTLGAERALRLKNALSEVADQMVIEEQRKLATLKQRFPFALRYVDAASIFFGKKFLFYSLLAGSSLAREIKTIIHNKWGYLFGFKDGSQFEVDVKNVLWTAWMLRSFILIIFGLAVGLGIQASFVDGMNWFAALFLLCLGWLFVSYVAKVGLSPEVYHGLKTIGLYFTVKVISKKTWKNIHKRFWIGWISILFSFGLVVFFSEWRLIDRFSFIYYFLIIALPISSMPLLDAEEQSEKHILHSYIAIVIYATAFIMVYLDAPFLLAFYAALCWWSLLWVIDQLYLPCKNDFVRLKKHRFIYIIFILTVGLPLMAVYFSRRFSENAIIAALVMALLLSLGRYGYWLMPITLGVTLFLGIINTLGERLAKNYLQPYLDNRQAA